MARSVRRALHSGPERDCIRRFSGQYLFRDRCGTSGALRSGGTSDVSATTEEDPAITAAGMGSTSGAVSAEARSEVTVAALRDGGEPNMGPLLTVDVPVQVREVPSQCAIVMGSPAAAYASWIVKDPRIQAGLETHC